MGTTMSALLRKAGKLSWCLFIIDESAPERVERNMRIRKRKQEEGEEEEEAMEEEKQEEMEEWGKEEK